MTRLAWLSAVLLLVVAACASNMQTVQDEPLEGAETQSFDAPYADVVRAADEAITQEKRLDVTRRQEQPEGFAILFVRRTSMTQWGGAGRLLIERGNTPPTVVHLTYDRRWGMGGAGQERWARLIFARMRDVLRRGDASKKS